MSVDHEVERKRFKTYSPEVGLLLWAVWDPIGAGVPLDEYDNYVPTIWRLLTEDAAVEEIAAELRRICVEQIGVGPGGERDAAERLKAWWYWRFEYPEQMRQ